MKSGRVCPYKNKNGLMVSVMFKRIGRWHNGRAFFSSMNKVPSSIPGTIKINNLLAE